jgi:hypothetical protein
MGRPRTAKHPKIVKEIPVEEESQEIPDVEGGGQEGHGITAPSGFEMHGKQMTKAQVCRATLAEGIESAQEAVSYVKAKFGVDIKPTDFSLYKSKAKKQDGSPKGKPGRKPMQATEASQIAPMPRPQPAVGDARLIEALEAMKPLVASLGAEKVKRLVDLLG